MLCKGLRGVGHMIVSPLGASLLEEIDVHGVIRVLMRGTPLSRSHQHLIFLLEDGTALLQFT